LTFPVLHPRHKLSYFKVAGWDQDWINTARDLVREQFALRYASRAVAQDTPQVPGGIETVEIQSMVCDEFTHACCGVLKALNRRNLQKTYSTISRPWPPFTTPLFLMNLHCTSTRSPKTSRTPFSGGMRSAKPTHDFIEWHWII